MLGKNYREKYSEYLTYINDKLEKYCSELTTVPEILGDSMHYSVMLGGKRIRPVLMLSVGEILGIEREELAPYAVALELIHTYSLIHDDLPEMDNDDFRRGKPSNHKKFGVGNALLAGDGLLNSAYSLLFEQCFKGSDYTSAAKLVCECAGIYGMIAGQSADLKHEHDENPSEETLEYIYENKTAKLITAAVTVPSVLKGGKYYSELKTFGKKLGYLFQLTDDILDVAGEFEKVGKTLGKDKQEDKLTGIKLYGVDGCRLRADVVGDDCYKILDGVDGDATFLYDFVTDIKTRVG